MNRNEFNRFIAGGALPGPGDLEGLRELTALFPWFHSAHMVLLRGLKENADIRFDAQLKASAVFVSDREVLYHYLFMQPAGEVNEVEVAREEVAPAEAKQEEAVREEIAPAEVVQEEVAPTGVANVEVAPEGAVQEVVVTAEVVQDEATPEKAVRDEIEQVEAVHDEVKPEEVAQVEAVPETTAAPVAAESTERTREVLMAEIETRLEELAPRPEEVPAPEHVIAPAAEVTVVTAESEQEPPGDELLELVADNEPAGAEQVQKLSPQDLIDRFIKSSPTLERIPLTEPQPVKDLSDSSSEETGTFITETLAKIYINQGYYTRAINIYEKLSLQFPEKSAYFAGRIEKIKDLINR